MGSIVAILGRVASADQAAGLRMLAVSPHRGTEFIVRKCGHCVLGVSYKPDFVNSQISSEGPLMAVITGKLDNCEELKSQLSQLGYPPQTANPADIVVALIKAFGQDAPNRMRGIFSAIATNGRQIWCFRDQLGFKPLFYRDDAKAVFFATEVKQIIAGSGLKREANPEAIDHLLFGNATADKPCAIKGVNLARQATTYTASIDSEIRAHRDWEPEKLLETSRLNLQDIADRFDTLFSQAVSRCLTGEDILELSGGIDSSAIAAYASKQHLCISGRPLSALSAVFPHFPKVDESRYIRINADAHGIKLHTYEIKSGVLNDVERWCELLDSPVYTLSIPELYEDYTLCRQLGFRNILRGDVAEFTIGFRGHIMGHLFTRNRWKALGRLIDAELRQGRAKRDLVRELTYSLVPGHFANWYLRRRGPDPRKWIPEWVDHDRVRQEPYRPDLLTPVRDRWVSQQLVAFKGSTLLDESVDVCADLCGVTVRRPFADIDLWEFFLSLPAEVKIPDLHLKTFLRQLLRGKVPDEILDRRDKTVFNEHIKSRIDYTSLRNYLLNPTLKIKGIDYTRLRKRIEQNEVSIFDWFMACTLIRVNAFLSLS